MQGFWALWGNLGALFQHPWAPFGYPWGPCWCLVGTFGCGPGPLEPLLKKIFKKVTQSGRRNGDKLNEILSLCKKWRTVFGLRLCSRIRVRAPCFQPLSLHWGPLFFQCFFDVFWAPRKTQKSATGKSRRQGRHPVNGLQEQSSCHLYFDSLLPLRYRAFYMQPDGLVPRARGRIYRLPPLPPTSGT